MATKAAFDRLRKEYARLIKNPVDHIEAIPLESNILEWHYVIRGPKGSPYEDGIYHGKLVFPPQYPFKPPSILMFTPSGRFKTDTRLCLSMSDFHPETWNPLWSVASILSGLLSFMLETTPTLGSVDTSDAMKREYASRSLEHNCKNVTFRKLFPEYLKQFKDASDGATDTGDEEKNERIDPSSTPAQSTSTVKQRRGTGEPGAAAGPLLAGVQAVPAAGGAQANVAMIELFGGRVKIREESIYDILVALIALCTLIFAAIYLSGKKSTGA